MPKFTTRHQVVDILCNVVCRAEQVCAYLGYVLFEILRRSILLYGDMEVVACDHITLSGSRVCG